MVTPSSLRDPDPGARAIDLEGIDAAEADRLRTVEVAIRNDAVEAAVGAARRGVVAVVRPDIG